MYRNGSAVPEIEIDVNALLRSAGTSTSSKMTITESSIAMIGGFIIFTSDFGVNFSFFSTGNDSE
jgi:hypothetical protein